VHHVGILYGQFMMHGQRNIKSAPTCFGLIAIIREHIIWALLKLTINLAKLK